MGLQDDGAVVGQTEAGEEGATDGVAVLFEADLKDELAGQRNAGLCQVFLQSGLGLFLDFLAGWALGISTFRSPINILPIAASSFVTISLWLDNPRLTKLISLPVCTAFFIYDFSIGSYVGIVNESISIFSIALSFIKEGKQI